ncbi:hypothetical protein BH24ACT3_BH24ACT3_06190 [soil metagenome]
MRSNWNFIDLAGGLAAVLVGLALLLDRRGTIELEPVELLASVVLAAGLAALLVAVTRGVGGGGKRRGKATGPQPLDDE